MWQCSLWQRSQHRFQVTSAISQSQAGLRSRTGSKMMSPRSANYERIEGGMGPGRGQPPKQRLAWTWKKFAIGAAVLIGMVYVFGPREKRTMPWSDGNVEEEVSIPQTTQRPPPMPSPAETTSTVPVQSLPHIDDDAPLSFETDANPSGTTFCSTPYSHNQPLVQYALMLDAGSTGSRIHIYKFNNCKANPTYEYEVFKMTRPGLSAYPESPGLAAASLDDLMDEAVRVIPEAYRKCAPVQVKATAGLRMLGEAASEAILAKVRDRLQTKYPFSFHSAEVMDGKDEGVFAWVTANYLLGTLSSEEKTYAVLDLGGASTQIVFEPKWDDNTGKLEDGEHKYGLTFSGQSHVLYQHSYLGYGLMRARRSVHQLVEFMDSIRISSSSLIANPCLAKGTERDIDLDGRSLRMSGSDVGSFDACNRIIQLVMAKDAVCSLKPCSFNGVYQPSLLDSFPGGKVLLLSYFFDRVDPLVNGSQDLNVQDISDLAQTVCQGREAWLPRWGKDEHLMKELDDRPEWCLDLTFMHGLLQMGYEFESERHVMLGKKIAGTELGWCLGATLAMIGGDLKCRD